MFSNISLGAKYTTYKAFIYIIIIFNKNIFLHKNMLIFGEIFKTQSDQKIYQNAPYFQNFLMTA